MELIKDKYFDGERPLYARQGLRLSQVKIGPGESSLKECADVEADGCEFAGKYPFWECDGFTVRNSVFREGARAALWYTRDGKMYDTLVEAPKMFRRLSGMYLENVQLVNALETFWDCEDVVLKKVEAAKADYIFMHSSRLDVEDFKLQGNYSFQYAKDTVIRNSFLDTKDAFWESENVTVYDSVIRGEFLGWYAKNLRLVRCTIGGTQPLCYCENLVLEDCVLEPSCDLSFEYSSVEATVRGNITSVKNPRSGFIKADSIGEVIIDQNLKKPGNCEIQF